MISYQDARYIVTEINRIPYYRECIAGYKAEIDDLEKKKEALAMPSSPNGKESIGDAKGNEVWDYTKVLIDIIAAQDEINQEMYDYIRMLRKAEKYQAELYRSAEAEYSMDYFTERNKRVLEAKYHVGNAYDKILRIVRSCIERK